MTLVIDSSVALAWIYTGEMTLPVQQVFDRVISGRGWVPAIWRLEIANSLLMAIRRGRIDAAFRDAALTDLALLDIATDPDTDVFAWSETMRLADSCRLTLYDAAYLELAQRRGLALATLDHELRGACSKIGIPLLGV